MHADHSTVINEIVKDEKWEIVHDGERKMWVTHGTARGYLFLTIYDDGIEYIVHCGSGEKTTVELEFDDCGDPIVVVNTPFMTVHLA